MTDPDLPDDLNRRLRRTINNMNKVPECIKHDIDVDINSIDSRTFKKKKKKLQDALLDDTSPLIVKFKIANFFCNKISIIYNIPQDLSDILIDTVYDIVYKGVELPITTRLRYMRFQYEKIAFSASVKLFENNVRAVLEYIPYFQILKYILKNSLAGEIIMNIILDEFEVLFANNAVNQFIKMEIADIFLLNNRVQRGNQMLAVLRGYRVINVDHKQTVYDDSQNVHDEKVNNSVLRAACKLIETNRETDFDEVKVKKELVGMSRVSEKDVIKVMERIDIDTSRFMYDGNQFSLYILFANLWRYICVHKDAKELKIRLLEEIISMAMYCSTGHLARFINVIQGFTDDPDLCITISNSAQMNAVVSIVLQKMLDDAPDDVMDSMIDSDQTIFSNFVVEEMNKEIPKIIKEYGHNDADIYKNILEAVITYTKYTEFHLDKNNKLELLNSL